MKKAKQSKFSFEKFEMAKLKNRKIIVGGSDLPQLNADELTIPVDDSDRPIRPATTI